MISKRENPHTKPGARGPNLLAASCLMGFFKTVFYSYSIFTFFFKFSCRREIAGWGGETTPNHIIKKSYKLHLGSYTTNASHHLSVEIDSKLDSTHLITNIASLVAATPAINPGTYGLNTSNGRWWTHKLMAKLWQGKSVALTLRVQHRAVWASPRKMHFVLRSSRSPQGC